MVLRPAHQHEIEDWDSLVKNNPDEGSFLQGLSFASIKQSSWKTLYFIYTNQEQTIAILVLSRSLPLLGDMWYLPTGPGVNSTTELNSVLKAIKVYITEKKLPVFVVKVEPRIAPFIPNDASHLIQSTPIQPPATIILDANIPAEELIDHLGRRARRYVRVGEREGVTVQEVSLSKDNMTKMYQLMGSAFGGKGIPGRRTQAYYENFWQTFEKAGQGKLYFAFHENVPVAGVYLVTYGTKAIYKDGGSQHGRQTKGATYLIHWEIMKTLQAVGVTSYDLWGMPPSSHVDDNTHPLYGLATFKLAFSDQVTDYAGVLDYPVHPGKYKLWLKSARYFQRYWITVKKEGFY